MKINVRKNKFGFQFQTDTNGGWQYFPDGIKDQQGMLKYFATKYDESQLTFLDMSGKPTVYYNIQRGKTFANRNFAVCDFDPDKRIVFEDSDFVSDAEQIEFFKIHSAREVDMEADKLETSRERLNLYKKHADTEALNGLDALINEKYTDEAIKRICQDHAAKYYNNSMAVVEFDK